MANTTVIELTGNWREGDAFPPEIQTSEPDLAPGEIRTFRQSPVLPPGRYRLEVLYRTWWDSEQGRAIDQRYSDFRGLSVNGVAVPLAFESYDEPEPLFPLDTSKWHDTAFQPTAVDKADFRASASVDLSDDGIVEIALAWRATRPPRIRLHAETPLPAKPEFQALGSVDNGEVILAHGIPFAARRLDAQYLSAFLDIVGHKDRDLADWEDECVVPCHGARAQVAHFLGMIHSIDYANGSWYSPKGDQGYSHFVGDRAGEITVVWEDGRNASVPLIFGYNLWFGMPWDQMWHAQPYGYGSGATPNFDAELFAGDRTPMREIASSLALVDGVRLMGNYSCNARYVFSLELDDQPLKAIRFSGVPELHGHPVISAVTLQSNANAPHSNSLPQIGVSAPNLKLATLGDIAAESYRPEIERVMRRLYAFKRDVPELTSPVIPPGYFGPSYRFTGTPEALAAATYLYHNGPECAAYIADSGTGCSSATARKSLFQYSTGIGIWRSVTPMYDGQQDWFRRYQEGVPGKFPGTGGAWTRGIGELMREAAAFGYDKYLTIYVDWLDGCLSECSPPHWQRVAGSGDNGVDNKHRTIGGIVETGNRENDGHGICMWGRAMVWHRFGRPSDWNAERFEATKRAVEWVQWQLDTDAEFPGARKDVLYTESECAHGGYDIYSTYNCLHGVKLSVRMAEQLGEHDVAERWRRLARRLQQGALDHLVDHDDVDGGVWHGDPACDWQDFAHTLVPLQLAPDGETYTPLQDYAIGSGLDRQCLRISQNTYRKLMRHKSYDCLRMYGYGQGMMTQAALLLDEMEDAEKFIEKLVTYAYLPNLEGWIGPEGIIVHRSGEYYVPVNGYSGQDSHVADSSKALRLMLGIDDNDPEHLKLVPRVPASWRSVAIGEFPVVTDRGSQTISYEYDRSPDCDVFHVAFQNRVERFSLRLGPYPIGEPIVRALCDGVETDYEILDSGDSRWLWIRDIAATDAVIRIERAGHFGSLDGPGTPSAAQKEYVRR